MIFSNPGFQTETQNERKVLVLGLDNSGKSTLLANISKNDPTSVTQPTQGFKVICYQTGKIKLSFWESMLNHPKCVVSRI